MNNNPNQFYLRRKFSLVLTPIKILLLNKKNSLSGDDWFNYVQKTKERVLANPEEYLGKELPEAEVVLDAVEFIFHDFLVRNYKNSKILKVRMNAYRSRSL